MYVNKGVVVVVGGRGHSVLKYNIHQPVSALAFAACNVSKKDTVVNNLVPKKPRG